MYHVHACMHAHPAACCHVWLDEQRLVGASLHLRHESGGAIVLGDTLEDKGQVPARQHRQYTPTQMNETHGYQTVYRTFLWGVHDGIDTFTVLDKGLQMMITV